MSGMVDAIKGPGAGVVDGPGVVAGVGVEVTIGSSGATLSRLLERGIVDYIKIEDDFF